MKAIFLAAVMGLAPMAALAAGCSDHGTEARMSCAEGQVWDAASQSCKAGATS